MHTLRDTHHTVTVTQHKNKKMNEKKHYVWQLGAFLANQGMIMSGEELAEHLNRNSFLTNYGTEYKGRRGTYKLIRETTIG